MTEPGIPVHWKELDGRCEGLPFGRGYRWHARSELVFWAATPGTGGSPVVVHEVCRDCAERLKDYYAHQRT